MAVQHAVEHTGVVVCVVSRGGSSACCGTYGCGGLCCEQGWEFSMLWNILVWWSVL